MTVFEIPAGSTGHHAPAPAALSGATVTRVDAPSSSPSAIPAYLLAGSGAGPTVPVSDLATLGRIPLLRQLGQLPTSTLASFMTNNPDVITSLLASPPAASDVSAWWSGLDTAATDSLTSAATQLVGNLDGIPVAVRDSANRAWLDDAVADREKTLTGESSLGDMVAARSEIHMLGEVTKALGTADSVPARRLLTVDAEGDGRAAVVLGDLATADYVTYLVPGMFFTIDGQINDWTDDAARIYEEQVSWLNLIGSTDPGEASKTVAVVAWMGYETPDLTSITSLELAGEGRDAIASTIQGLLAERAGNEPYVSVIAHSYGSTAALMALTEYDFEIDSLAVIGSPGSAAQSVDELHVRNGNVFVGEAAWDPVPNTAFFGSDPGSESYGAKHINVSGGIDLITNEVLAASVGHNGYFTAGSESVRNLALIGIGQEELVTDGSQDDNEKTLALVR